jgi:hypothetical protein
MITPKAFGQIIKHFDEIDKVVSAKTMRKRPWLEVALTSLLCDLLDEQTQDDEKLAYTFKQLQDDLRQQDGLFGIHLSLETIEFSSIYERYVSQSDIGLNLIFDNKIEPENSWTRPYLLQAKRLSPKNINPLIYSESSRFSSIDKEQEERIKILNDILGASYLKYLFFCPRPDNLDDDTKIKLAYLRNQTLSSQIFDYTIGLETYKELLSNSETLKAGIFITDVENSNINFGQVHNKILQSTFPFSWFIAMNFSDRHNFFHNTIDREKQNKQGYDNYDNEELVEGILSGNRHKIAEFIKKINETEIGNIPGNIQILPKHKITLRYSIGEQINVQRQVIQKE